LVRVEAVGICGSDTHNFIEGSVGDTPSVYPMVLGHEPAGVVVKTGAGVAGWAAGDRVALEPAIYCRHCEFCLAGRHNICRNIRFMSVPPDPGFFRQFVALPAENLLRLPAGMSPELATLFEPLAIVLHSLRLASLAPRETAAVFGAGPIGLMTVIMLKLCGASRVFAVEPVEHRRRMARNSGADAAFDPNEGEASRAILAGTGGRGVDVVFDCATKGDSIDQSLKSVRNGGRLVLTGIPVEVHTPFQTHTARRKELVIYNVRRSNRNSEDALNLLEEQSARFSPLITHVLPMEKIQGAFEMLEKYSDGCGKVVLRP